MQLLIIGQQSIYIFISIILSFQQLQILISSKELVQSIIYGKC